METNESLSRREFIKVAGAAAVGFLGAAAISSCEQTFPEDNMTSPDPNPEATLDYVYQSVDQYAFQYVYQWWADGLRAPEKIFNIQTGHFGLSFDFLRFQLRKFGIIRDPASEEEVLRQGNQPIEDLPASSLAASLELNGVSSRVIGAGRSFDDCQLVENGNHFQRRWLTFPAFEPERLEIDERESGLEISAWPDRITFLLRLVSQQDIAEARLSLSIRLPPGFSFFQENQGALGFKNNQDEGYVFLGLPQANPLQYDAGEESCSAQLEVTGWPAGEERQVGFIIYPVRAFSENYPKIIAQETQPLRVQALQEQPESHELEVFYQPELGWHQVLLRNDGVDSDYAESGNHRIELVKIHLENPDSHPRTLRLNFSKEGRVFGITGLSAILRDEQGNPLGIPVQLSKNWHKDGVPDQSKRFEGPWYHGLVQFTVPAGKKVNFEYVSVNAFWGQVPAASHAQLCLVGWGSNQLWDQTAVGSWGESLCFEPDQGQNVGAVLDTRPLLVWGMGEQPKKKWGWTHNVGGADFLVYYGQDVEKQFNSRMKTMYRRYGPNLTEVTYAGTSADQKIDLEYAVSLYRTDDITRGVYRFRYDVRQALEFSKLVFFQCGGYQYSYTREKKFAIGDENGLVKEWDTQWGGFNYRTGRMELKGKVPWISMHEAVKFVNFMNDQGAWANRGLVLRKWDARLGGRSAAPWVAEIGITLHGQDTSLIDFLPPEGLTGLQPGDYVEAEIVHVVVPQYAADYYGPNENLRQALRENENTWKMIYREASGNDLEVRVRRGGKLEHTYPICIRAIDQEVHFDVTGGLAYVPVTIRGLKNYRDYRLDHLVDGAWVAVDQSYHGNDYWQVDFNPSEQRWEITYSLALDTPQDERRRQQFRFVRSTT
jgi:hypothetical protein